MKYIDIKTKEIYNCSPMADGYLWKHFEDGSSARVGDEENLVPYSVWLMFDSFRQLTEGKLAIGQGSDNNPTSTGQRSDSAQTTTRQETDKNPTDEGWQDQAEKARNSKPKPLTSAQIIKNNADAVKLLKNAKFIKVFTEGVYNNFKELPQNCPQKLVDEINRRGIVRRSGKQHTQDTMSSVVQAMKEEARPKQMHVIFLIAAFCFFAIVGTKFYAWITSPAAEPARAEKQAEAKQKQANFDFDACFASWKKQTGKDLTKTRLDIIKQKSITDQAELMKEFSFQYNAMVEIMNRR